MMVLENALVRLKYIAYSGNKCRVQQPPPRQEIMAFLGD